LIYFPINSYKTLALSIVNASGDQGKKAKPRKKPIMIEKIIKKESIKPEASPNKQTKI
jgi:hypothetical protein